MCAEIPRVTFGIIVLNGEPFTRYNLRALYPFAHEIIVVEGAVQAAAGIATQDGHSIDGTLETLNRFKSEDDPEDKVRIVTRNGFWKEKDEQSQAYADLATGDFLWQVDIDEFYHPEDMKAIIQMLQTQPDITAVSFKQITFWGGLQYTADSWYLRRGAEIYHRLFKWGPGYKYVAHRPPTVYDQQGQDLRNLKWINRPQVSRREVVLHHYSLLFPRQVQEKCDYYANADWVKRDGIQSWADNNYMLLKNPLRVHNVYQYPSWLERFHDRHPPQIHQMWQDIKAGKVQVKVRQTQDIERLLSSLTYFFIRGFVREFEPVDRWWRRQVRHVRSRLLRKRDLNH